MRRRPRHLLLVAAMVATTACGAGGDARTGPITVLAASSVAVAVEEAAVSAGFDVAVVGAGSQVLAAQVEAGAPVDLVLLADPDAAAALEQQGLVGPAVPLVATGLAVVAPPDLADGLGISDLAVRERRVVLADEGVPLGDLTRAALAVLGQQRGDEGFAAAVLAGADSLEDAATSVVAKVASGEADLAIVYHANALRAAAGGDVRLVANLDDTGVRAVTTAQVATDAGSALLAALTSPAGRRVLLDHGFVVLGG